MAYGKSIELFLANGTADSLIIAELSNWNGKAIKIPRIEVADCKRDDINGAGVYFLFCKEEDDTIPSISENPKLYKIGSSSTFGITMPERRNSTGQQRLSF